MKRKVIPVLIGLLLIVLILAGAAGVFLFQRYSGSKEEADLNAYFGLNGSQEVAIVWNQELAEEKGLLQDERCYLKLDTVHEMLNERFYVDHNEKLLLYTLPEETVQIGIGEQTADGYTAAVEQDGDVWLALDYVKQYSDFNYTLYTEPNRVVLTTNWDTLQSAELKKNTALRVRGGVKSEVLQNLEKGTKVTVLEEMENWDQVQTQDGYIGYVQKKHLTDPAEETPVKDTGYVEPDYTGNLRDHKIDLAWHQVTVESANSTFPGVMSGVTGVNVISPTWYSLYDNTGVVDGIASPSYVQQAHALGLEVWALIDDFTHREDNGVDLHSYQPTADDIVKISDCDLFIYVGGESDEWVEDALRNAANRNMKVINLLEVLGDSVKTEEIVEGMQEEEYEHEDAEEHEHEDAEEHEHEEEADEHVWLSLKNAKMLVRVISKALQELDPDSKDIYAANADAYVKKLSALDAEYQTAVDAASNKTILFGDRFPFRYLVDDYGLRYYAAFVGCSAETEAGFETISFLAKRVDEWKLPCVLTIEGAQHKIAETIVRNTTAKNQRVLTMDSMQSTTSKDVKNGTTYLSVMEKNLSVLKEALR